MYTAIIPKTEALQIYPYLPKYQTVQIKRERNMIV
jgi:hypothetical protein